jgi:hypothetical protein
MASFANRTGQLWKLTQENGWYRITSYWQRERRSMEGRFNHPRMATSGPFSEQLWKLTALTKL